MNRQQHLDWSKKRAIDILESGDTHGAFASFLSDMQKHEELKNHMAIDMGIGLMMAGNLTTKQEMKNHIEGYN